MPGRADVEALMERLDGLSESQTDWYTALVLVGSQIAYLSRRKR